MTKVFTQGKYASDFILSEDDFGLSRDNGTVAAGSGVLDAGTVLSSAGVGKYTPVALPYDPANPATRASAILNGRVDATALDVETTVVTRVAQIKAGYLVYPVGATAADIDAINASLASRTLIVR
jgi:hypothetical protein